MKYNSYVICTAPRSGSTLLCSLLAATGVAGKPASYFYDPSVEDWLTELGLAKEAAWTEHDALVAALDAVVRAGRNGTPIFGLRQQARGLAFLCEKLAMLYPEAVSDAERFRLAFGKTLFIHLTRTDKVEQAISLLKAEQSGLWHVAPDGSELERIAPHADPSYDSERLRACFELVIAYDRAWQEWFKRENIEPLRLSYDSLSADPIGTLRSVLEQLGLDGTAANGVTPGVRKLADSTSQSWAARFRSEHTND